MLVIWKSGAMVAGMNGYSQGRRRFMAGAGAWLGASAAGWGANAERHRTISIFHTTDLHGHLLPTHTYEGRQNVGGFARCATCIRQWRQEVPDSLLVDIGDVYQGTAESRMNQGGLMLDLFKRLGYDAWTLGNHDFDWGREVLEKNLARSGSPVLTGNLRVDGKPTGGLDGAWRGVQPWLLKEVAGFRIALIGLVTPGLPYWLAPETLGGVEVVDPVAALRGSIAEARAANANAIVLLGHMGWRYQDDFANPVRRMLQESPGVDVLLAGHTHQDRPEWKSGNVLCTQASYHGIHCGRVDLTFDLASRKLVDRKVATELMDERFALDPSVMELAAPELAKAATQQARKLGTVARPIKGTGGESPLAAMFCESFAAALKRNGTPVEGVFHGTFGTGDLPAGDLTVADCWNLIPYENLLVTAELGASELVDIVREERKLRRSDRILWPFTLKFDRAGEVTSFLFQGQPVAADRRFTIACNSYDAQSGGQDLMRLRALTSQPSAKRATTRIDTRQALMDFILDRGTLP